MSDPARCECGHVESDHRSIPPYYCQSGLLVGNPCECPVFIEENADRLNAEYEAQKADDNREAMR